MGYFKQSWDTHRDLHYAASHNMLNIYPDTHSKICPIKIIKRHYKQEAKQNLILNLLELALFILAFAPS